MRHAILITAYTDFFHLIDLTNSFNEDFDIYIHIDKNIYVSPICLKILQYFPRVKSAEQVFHVNWGGRKHVDAILWLCKQALSLSTDAEYFHLISGTDLLVKDLQQFCNFFDKRKGTNFLEYFLLPYQGWESGGLNRLQYKHPLDQLNIKELHDRNVYNRFVNWQITSRRTRPLPNYPIYGGSSWWSLTRDTVNYIYQNYNQNGWYDRLEDTFIPEEMFIQTLLLNSPLKESIVPYNLRYIQWEHKHGSIPAILDEEDIPKILHSCALFARKTDSRISKKLINYFNNNRSSNL